MHFICDVHISYKVRTHLVKLGYHASHINKILQGDITDDLIIADYCFNNGCVLITKDFDFVDSYFLNKIPPKIIKINLGNVSTEELILILNAVLEKLRFVQNKEHFLIQADNDSITITTHND